MNGYAILADLVVAAHLGYIGVVVFGQLAILIGWPLGWQWIRNPWFRLFHMAMILFVVGEALVEYECPLTTWEIELRREAGQKVIEGEYDTGFIGRNLHNLMFIGADLGQQLLWIYYGFGAVVVLTLFFVPPQFRRPKQTPHVPAPEQPTISEAATAIIPPKNPQAG
jgi:hypothetical protein